tara:strand:- start:1757 stop:2437 length:681 start_codon:yes stop_codon:yes gene_type:complete
MRGISFKNLSSDNSGREIAMSKKILSILFFSSLAALMIFTRFEDKPDKEIVSKKIKNSNTPNLKNKQIQNIQNKKTASVTKSREEKIKRLLLEDPNYKETVTEFLKVNNEEVDKILAQDYEDLQKYLLDIAPTKSDLIARGLDPYMDGIEELDENDRVISIGAMEFVNEATDGVISDNKTEHSYSITEEERLYIETQGAQDLDSNEVINYLENLRYRYDIASRVGQ